MEPLVQISIDVTTTAEALEIAEVAVSAGVDWLEAGTPLVLGDGLHAVTALKEQFPQNTLVADLKIMDGGFQETKMAAEAGADLVVVMGRAPVATVHACVAAGKQYGCQIMGDVMLGAGGGRFDPVAQAKDLEAAGVDYVILHTSYDARHTVPMDPLKHVRAVVAAVGVPIQTVGGLTLEQLMTAPQAGVAVVVVGAPLVIANERFAAAGELSQLEIVLREVVQRVKGVAGLK